MPPLIVFMITRTAIGFTIGTAVGLFLWFNGLSQISTSSAPEKWLAFGLFIYLFASTFGGGYLATALMQDDV